MQGNPKIIASGENLEPRVQPRVGVAEEFKRLTVQSAGEWYVRFRFRNRVIFLFENRLANALGMQRRAVKEGAHLRGLPICRKHIELFFGTLIIPGKTQQLEQESAAPGVCGILPQLSAKRLHCLVALARLEQLVSFHVWGRNPAPVLSPSRFL